MPASLCPGAHVDAIAPPCEQPDIVTPGGAVAESEYGLFRIPTLPAPT
jgi:hypothetical protein